MKSWYRCKICSIFLPTQENILAHFFNRHDKGLDSFEEIILPQVSILLDKCQVTTIKTVSSKSLEEDVKIENVNDLMQVSVKSEPVYEEEGVNSIYDDYCANSLLDDDPFGIMPHDEEEDKPLPSRRSLRPNKRSRKSLKLDNSEDEFDSDGDDGSDYDSNRELEDEGKGGDKVPRKRKALISISRTKQAGVGVERNWIICPYCPTKSSTWIRGQVHILRVHQGIENPFQCDLCPRAFKSMTTVMVHTDLRHLATISTELLSPPDPEGVARTQFDQETTFNKMFQVKRQDNLVAADVGQAPPKPPKRIYPKKEHPDRPFSCNQCGLNFSKDWILTGHILRCHYGDQQAFKCDFCPKRFHAKVLLFSHRASSHPSTTPESYQGSSQSIQERIAQLEEKKTIKNKKKKPLPPPIIPNNSYTCTQCSTTHSTPLICAAHLKRCHEPITSKFPCSSCPLLFLTESGRRIHHDQFHIKKVGLPSRPLFCVPCNKDFGTPLSFSRHSVIHTRKGQPKLLKRIRKNKKTKKKCGDADPGNHLVEEDVQVENVDESSQILVKSEPMEEEESENSMRCDDYCGNNAIMDNDPFGITPHDDEAALPSRRRSLRSIKRSRESLKRDDSEDEGDSDGSAYDNSNGELEEDEGERNRVSRNKKNSRIKEGGVGVERNWKKCPYCPTKSSTWIRGQVHILRVHQGVENPFQCDLCPRAFKSLKTVMVHMDLRHQSTISTELLSQPNPEVEEQAISHQETLFNTMFEVKRQDDIVAVHEQSPPKPPRRIYPKKENPDRPFSCHKCGLNFSKEWILNGHILRCHYGDRQAFKCDFCPKRFHAKVLLFSHRASSHPSTTPESYEGSSQSIEERIAQLEEKKRIKNKKKKALPPPIIPNNSYTCIKCATTHSTTLVCAAHIKRCHEPITSKFPCSICSLLFLTESGRRIHHDQFHLKKVGLPSRPLFCVPCNKEFGTPLSFSRHAVIHTREGQGQPKLPLPQPHLCELCPQTFTQLSYLQRHQVRVHHQELGLNPFTCEICGRVLNTERNLKIHIVVKHTKQFKYPCPHAPCKVGFQVETQLRNHIKIVHLKERNYKCDQCTKSFSLSYHLKNHMRVHTGEKPFKCSTCGKEYSDKSTYNRHLQTHGDTVHLCTTCGKEFKVWHAFRMHCKSHKINLVHPNNAIVQ